MFRYFIFITVFGCFLLNGKAISQKYYLINESFDEKSIPAIPNYSELYCWAAHPQKSDNADKLPKNHLGLIDNQKDAKADVFFVYPTIYTYLPTNVYLWNASVTDSVLNSKVDNSTILNQASIFNGSCKVFAPRYRQSHYSVFTSQDKESCKKSLDLSYLDIKNAFEYYLKYENNGRPIIIASHSQGTVHAKRLLKDFFDGKPLSKSLVAAYLVGIATPPDYFEAIKPLEKEDDIGGFVSWNTYQRGYYPTYYKNGLNKALATNPQTWNSEGGISPRSENAGGVGLKFAIIKKAVNVESKDGMLWISKPYIPGRIFIKNKIWHAADYNLFWMNVRENVDLRINAFLK